MKLYDYKTPPNPRRVRIFLAEKGVSIPLVKINTLKGEQRTPEFLAMNPFGKLPVLELDNGNFLFESAAICRYIEELHPNPPLFGRNTEERAFVEMWQRAAEFELMTPIAMVFRHGTETGKVLEPDQNAALARTSHAHALKVMKIFDAELGKREFIAGPEFSVADIALLVGVDFGAITNAVQMPDNLMNLKRWHAEVSARPSAAA